MDNVRFAKHCLLHPVPAGLKRPFRGPRLTWRRRVYKDIDIHSIRNVLARRTRRFNENWLNFMIETAQNRQDYGELIKLTCAA